MTPQEVDGQALALYVAISRDVEYFLDESQTAEPEVLGLLFEMLTTPNPSIPEVDLETNRIGADLLRGIMGRRNIPIPGEPTAIEQVLAGVLADV